MSTEDLFVATLPKNVQDAMRENLPEQVSRLLREQLEKGEQALEDVADLEAENEQIKRKLEKNAWLDERERGLVAHQETLDEREKELQRQEDTLKLTHTQFQLDAERRLTDALSETLKGLVRNTVYREHKAFAHTPHTDYIDGGNVTTHVPSDEDRTTQAE